MAMERDWGEASGSRLDSTNFTHPLVAIAWTWLHRLVSLCHIIRLSPGIIVNLLFFMTPRVLPLAILVLACGPALAATTTPVARPAPTARAAPVAQPALTAPPAPGARPTRTARPVPRTAPVPPMTFYVAKGEADSCGRGCDSWIAVEGQVDSGAAPRFRKFLQKVRARNLPIYFSSPGGNLDQAVAMGAMLREKPTIARVARTVVRECGFEAQDSDACMKLKQSGRELHGELWTRGAMCNSACPYLMLGASTREIGPDVVLAVHSPKVVVRFSGNGAPTAEMRAAATVRGLERADRMLSSYIVRMGALGCSIREHRLPRHSCADPRRDYPLRHRPPRAGGDTVDLRKHRPQHGPQDRHPEDRRRQILSPVAMAAVLLQYRPVRTRFPASDRRVVGLSGGSDFQQRFDFAVFQIAAAQGAGI